ncbi:MAG TPA: GH32 C-terminal domain-containing protein [Chthoniobacterales bacterium]
MKIPALISIAALAAALVDPHPALAQVQPTYQEQFRPQYHYTPAKNWMNDPNGLVSYRGKHHMFYQYNPVADTWGATISWGHAVSTDMVHWEELPVAIPATDTLSIFSGSAVVDEKDTSGFGTPRNPPLVAIYTIVYRTDGTDPTDGSVIPQGTQAQAIAFSTDEGLTWTPYEKNPVINPNKDPSLNPQEFRDPKVFWYKPSKQWIMAIALPVQHKIRFYSSPDLKNWTYLSDFGPANAVGGIWEVPDLFELPVDATPRDKTSDQLASQPDQNASKKPGNDKEKPRNSKWVLVVNLNPGSVAGGSGAQYFIGHFDGVQFHAENVYDNSPPPGVVFQDFEADTTFEAAGWTPTGDFVGEGPALGTLPNQQPVSGYLGDRLVNTFINVDASKGTLTSPAFTVDSKYINLLVGGGRHPHDPAAGDGENPTGDLVFPGADFEGPDGTTYEHLGWVTEGAFVGQQPVTGNQFDPGFVGLKHVQSFIGSDAAMGSLTSPLFEITSPYINFVIGSGNHPYPDDPMPTGALLLVNGQVVRTATGKNDPNMDWVAWEVSDLVGQMAQIKIVDQNDGTSGFGHITVDHFIQSDEPALPRPKETTVNLIIDGKMVRSATGENSEQLHWTAWNVAEFAGKQAQIQIVDQNDGGFGHILVDHILFSDEAKKRADWIDYGRDFYAVISWNNLPDNKRRWVAWMNNWDYAGSIPTSPWRSAMSILRDVSLETRDGKVRLVQTPIPEQRKLRRGFGFDRNGLKGYFFDQNRLINETTSALGLNSIGARGKTLEIIAEFEVGTASEFGLKVRTGQDEETLIGYNAIAGELFVDRTKSGQVAFSTLFPSRETAPLAAKKGRVELHIFVDWSSVEVFADDGQVSITDQIFPKPSSEGLALFANGGIAKLVSLHIWQLESIWEKKR